MSFRPFKEEGFNKIYDLLFCDHIDSFKTGTKDYPWDILLAHEPDIESLHSVAADHSLESRQRLLAFHLLRQQAEVTEKELLGIVIEVALPEGLDVLAAYHDGSARYLNHAEKMIVWETRTKESEAAIAKLFESGINVVNRIGPWNDERTSFPVEGMVKMSFLVSDGLYFGEGPFEVLQQDPMGGPVISAAIRLMTYLIDQNSSR